MKLFACPNCGARLYFENSKCLTCGSFVVYAPGQSQFVMLGSPAGFACRNADECACNWAPERDNEFCLACRLNRTIPDLGIDGNRARWIHIEEAKKRLVYALLGFGLDVRPKDQPQDEVGIAFDLIQDDPQAPGQVMTGHDNGVITLNAAEADPVERERMRLEMGETYRTLLGHFRHEVGHYYWDRLVRDMPRLERFRLLFGDERRDYAQALQAHYLDGPPPAWQESHISPYAASHPWEDWAETWAHYLHITDTLEMAESLEIRLRTPAGAEARERVADLEEHGQSSAGDIQSLLSRWLALSEAANALNRCMGLPDLYPFVISPQVAAKLDFVQETLSKTRQAGGAEPAAA